MVVRNGNFNVKMYKDFVLSLLKQLFSNLLTNIYDPVLLISARISARELNILEDPRWSQKILQGVCVKIIMLKKKMKSPFQTQYNCDWIKFSCYSSDKGFRKIDEVNIWRGKKQNNFPEKPTHQGIIALPYWFFTLIILV